MISPVTKRLAERLLKEAISAWANESFLLVLNDVRRNLSGIVLKRRSGRLRDSVPLNSRVYDNGFEIGTNVIYGIAWEFGFHRKAYAINPRKPGGVLAWEDASSQRAGLRGKRMRFAKYVFIPAQDFAARPWLRPAIDKNMARIEKNLRDKIEPIVDGIFPGWSVDVRIT